MQTKYILLFLCVSLLIFLFFIQNKDSHDSQIVEVIEPKKNNPSSVDLQPIDKEEITQSIQNVPVNKNNTEEITTPIKEELIYSSDPVVNAYTVYKQHEYCYGQLENSNSQSVYLRGFLQRMEKQQAEFFENYIDYCKELDRQNPEYSLSNKDQMLSKMKNAKANSLWGQILTKEIKVEDLTPNEIQSLLKSNDFNILQDAPQYFEEHYLEVIHWDLESYLGNHDYDYVNYIRQLAHQMYLCNIGADCQPNSSVMVGLCYQNVSACGLDFDGYVNNSLTPGQQADIDLALIYLSNQYQ